jgi:hypothetical protein
MAISLLVLCIINFLWGVLTSITATTIFQQIIGAISFISAAILLIGTAIVGSLDTLTKHVKALKDTGIKI